MKKFLPGVVKSSSKEGVEVVVADNGSTDRSIEMLKNEFPSVKLIVLDKNYGFAGGYNKALEKIDSEYYILLNSDVEVTENWITPIIDYLDLNPKIGAAQPKLRSYDNPEYFEYAGAAGGFIDKYGYTFCRGRIFQTVEKDEGQYDDLVEIFWATGACMYVRAEAFKKAGGFDNEFFAHMEEIDLCWRMKWLGYQIIYHPGVTIYHVGGGALPKENPRKTYLNFRNNLYLIYKNLPRHNFYKTLITRMIIDLGAIVKNLAERKFKHSGAIIEAQLNFFKKISYLHKCRKSEVYKNFELANFFGVLNKSILMGYYFKKWKKFSRFTNTWQ